MSVVVTGATGHLGRLVVENLLDRGVPADQVVAVGRRAETLADLAGRGVQVRRADFGDRASLDEALRGAESVLLVSGSEVGRRVAQHAQVIDAAQAAGVRHLAYTSAPHADTTSLILAPEHKATEELIRASGLPFTFLRNSWYTENYLGDLEQARSTGEVLSSVGEGRVASASRADYAAAAAAVLTGTGHDGAVYELSGDTAWDFAELAAAISQVIGRDVVYRSVTPAERLAGLLAAGLDEGTAQFVVALEGNTRDGLLAETTGDLARLIGRPTTPLVDGLRAAL
ncbi:NAD(P)-dependent oxidoreductase (plasmid) [Cellulomonas sp. WB94]|uniref:SDR family oxidoreductase n=1 Tax=Cellulomonas sp. WB94 TaxID=2173174 RepID=UPI000D57E646|nr:SDR family oxidoreductase [Cellulomonas sp. WB94]PVU81458.1 NAD(P)-dependent oxidoreductase [Cellulomonas sp. WB94]